MTEKNGRNVIHTEHLKKYYIMGDIEVRALHDISLDINYGEFTAIMGPSGSGKSTLMNILGCLDRPSSGVYILDGTDVSKMDDSKLADVRNQKIGFVFQSFNLLPRSSALENVMMPLLYSKNKNHMKERAAEALDMVGLGSRLEHKPKELSGGQQQRVAVARALVNDPEIIMADEPTGNLDSKSGKEIMQLLIKLNQNKGKTVLMVTHDPKIGRQVPRVISVFDGMLGTEEEQEIIKNWTKPDFLDVTGYQNPKVKDENGNHLNGIINNPNGSDKEEGTPADPAKPEIKNEAEKSSAADALAEAFGISDDYLEDDEEESSAADALAEAFGNGKKSDPEKNMVEKKIEQDQSAESAEGGAK